MAKKQQEVKDNLPILKQDIREKRPGRLYFFYGEETFLLHHYLDQLKKLLVDELTEAFNFHKLTSETFDIQSFADSVENLPMMAESTFVWVDEVDLFKMNEGDREKMAQLLRDIPDYCTVVFTYITVAWNPDKRLKKLWDAVERGTAVEFGRQEPRDLIPWITRHFAARKKRITPELCHYLIEITGGTMTALAGEIDKIASFSGAEDIHKSDIDAVTEPVLDAVVYSMTDHMTRGEYGQALLKLRTLLKMQQEPVVLLGSIGGHFRRLSTARTLLDHGKGSAELCRLTGIRDYPARKAMSAAGKFTPRFLAKASELILETDRKLKTSFDDPDRLLELLILQLSQEARYGKN